MGFPVAVHGHCLVADRIVTDKGCVAHGVNRLDLPVVGVEDCVGRVARRIDGGNSVLGAVVDRLRCSSPRKIKGVRLI